MLHHVVYYVALHHIMPYYVLYHVTPYYVILCHIVHCVMLHYVCHVKPYYVTSHIILCHVSPFYVILTIPNRPLICSRPFASSKPLTWLKKCLLAHLASRHSTPRITGLGGCTTRVMTRGIMRWQRGSIIIRDRYENCGYFGRNWSEIGVNLVLFWYFLVFFGTFWYFLVLFWHIFAQFWNFLALFYHFLSHSISF